MIAIVLLAAAMVPGLIAYNAPPSSTLLNQVAALALWGLAMTATAATGTAPAHIALKRVDVLTIALALMGFSVLASTASSGL